MTLNVTSNVFQAKYPGVCKNCNIDYEPGEDLVRDDGAYVHAVCGLTNTAPVARTGVCHVCFLERAMDGSCGCDEE